MNQKEIELRIKNLEENLSSLASKQYVRTVDNEDKIQKTDSELSSTKNSLEEQLSLADETAIELYEAQMAQEEINNAQDEALIEIYEMLS